MRLDLAGTVRCVGFWLGPAR